MCRKNEEMNLNFVVAHNCLRTEYGASEKSVAESTPASKLPRFHFCYFMEKRESNTLLILAGIPRFIWILALLNYQENFGIELEEPGAPLPKKIPRLRSSDRQSSLDAGSLQRLKWLIISTSKPHSIGTAWNLRATTMEYQDLVAIR